MKSQRYLKDLQKIVSGQILVEKEVLRYYSVDASSYQVLPRMVVIPKNEKDVSNTVKFGRRMNLSVTVRGAGTGLVGSALNNGIIIDLREFNSIRIEKNTATVGTGASKGELDKKLNEKGKFFPPNPSVGLFCSIGGMIGNNSSGSHSLKYGSMIDNVKEITLINGEGKKITLPKNKTIGKKIVAISKCIELEKYPKTSKNSSGYRLDKIKSFKDSHKVLVGSEGTLGIILSAKIKIMNIPKRRILYVIGYPSLNKAASNCQDILSSNPSAIEFVDKSTLMQFPPKFNKSTKCVLLVEYDSEIKNKFMLTKIFTGNIIKITSDDSEIKKWWRYRDSSLYYSLKSINSKERLPHIIEDAAVPVEKLEKLFMLIHKINTKFHTKSIAYGHAGNGNIHIRLIANREKTDYLNDIATLYFNEIIRMNGTITGEHGDGLARSEFVSKLYGQKNYALFKQLKKIFDPYEILNPGKIINKGSKMLKNLEKMPNV